MGQIGFQPWLRSKCKELIKNTLENVTDGKTVRRLLIDLNGLIHNAVTLLYGILSKSDMENLRDAPETFWTSNGGIMDIFVAELVEVVILIEPKRLLYLAADGVVPKAKMLQQRQRSFLASDEPFNRNNIKPGTEFMIMFSTELRRRITLLGKKNIKGWPSMVEFSDASQPGEGEHKIMQKMAEKPERKGAFFNEIDVIYSPDSDMHLLVWLNAVHNQTVIIFRQTHSWVSGSDDNDDAGGLTEGEDPRYAGIRNKSEFLNTTAIRRELLGRGFKDINDLVLITFFAGNDFLPGLPYTKINRVKVEEDFIDVFEDLIQTYFRTFGKGGKEGKLIIGTKIQWSALARYVENLRDLSARRLGAMAIYQSKNTELFVDEENGIDQTWGIVAEAWKAGFSTRKQGKQTKVFNHMIFNMLYRKQVGGVFQYPTGYEEMNFDIMSEMAFNYLEGIQWVYTYFRTQDREVNLDWGYTFHYAPTTDVLAEYLSKFGSTSNPDWETVPMLPSSILHTPVEHLLTILRSKDLDLVPKVAKILFMEKMPYLYPEKVQIDTNFQPIERSSSLTDDEDDEAKESKPKVSHKSVVLCNYPRMHDIRELFESIRDDPLVKARNTPNNKIIVYNAFGKNRRK